MAGGVGDLGSSGQWRGERRHLLGLAAYELCDVEASELPHPKTPIHPLPSPHTTDSPLPGAKHTMLSRTTACRGAQRAARQQAVRPSQRRGLAAPASGSFQYQSGEVKGVKYASRDFTGPTTTLALVAKAGTRYQPLPGLTEGLANFAFRVRHVM